MPRPKTKSDLLAASEDGYAQLMEMLDSLTPSQRLATFPFAHRDKNIRDVLAHLHAWHLMMLDWYAAGMAGAKPEMPAPGYTWSSTPALNTAIWHEYQDTSLEEVRSKLEDSHDRLQQIIRAHTEDELFTKRHYQWTGTTSLGSYVTSATSSHYHWAIKLLRRFMRGLRQNTD
ncbi:MAG: ClbS/DfsB family four-helix bundle protein [Planctomycetota bacterium]